MLKGPDPTSEYLYIQWFKPVPIENSIISPDPIHFGTEKWIGV